MPLIKQATICYSPAWKLWPDTSDVDISEVVEARSSIDVEVDGTVYRVENRNIPAHIGYMWSGHLQLPHVHPEINNLIEPPRHVQDAQAQAIIELGEGCDILLWEHARQCYPRVMERVAGHFKLKLLRFGDDCPGSSELKTFPVARYFDVLLHGMNVWDFVSGRRVPDVYAEHGLHETYLELPNPTVGLLETLKADGFSLDDKIRKVHARTLDKDLCFVGLKSLRSWRAGLLHQLGGELAPHGIRTAYYGYGGMRDGVLEPRDHVLGLAYPVAKLYERTLCGLNTPISSVYNCRMMDLWFAGVVPIIHDKHGEMLEIGAEPYVDHLVFDGTADALYKHVKHMMDRPDLVEAIIRAGHKIAQRLYTSKRGIVRAYEAHLPRIV